MKHSKKITRDFGDGSFESAYVFKGSYDFDSVQDYFAEELCQYFGMSNSGPGCYFQNCYIWAKGSRTIAYINGGYDI